ncbi:ClpXP protease specificity-enhancing factor SspB [Temperatibacter marinus]|uniref:ClpXP protease specificity-enhancing factor SspB n=1 Tax=Temperatibacter marinus TaxID=1456591 RepID=A0AA52EHE6_9PROT|nr:ClpXP protease specificity-enhancing factor SspB [Temperatibacter marinus]WND02830.1 ClpXP protease specificity-enhancing factor SspB [Temperatibacter marinus]
MHIDYDGKVQTALRDVVKSVMSDVVKDGLDGDHHFYITFKTQQEGVEIPDHLTTEYPEEMTIVIQHKFWGLKVTDERLEVGLYFNRAPEMLYIPFVAITAFMDPSVQFALQFHDNLEDEDHDGLMDAETLEEAEAIIAAEEAKVQASAADDNSPAGEDKGGDNVVTLDFSRKK